MLQSYVFFGIIQNKVEKKGLTIGFT